MSKARLTETQRMSKAPLTEAQRLHFDLWEAQVAVAIRTDHTTKSQLVQMTQELFKDCPGEEEAFRFLCTVLLSHNDIRIACLSARVLQKLDLPAHMAIRMLRLGVLERYNGQIALSESMELAIDDLEQHAQKKGLGLLQVLSEAIDRATKTRVSDQSIECGQTMSVYEPLSEVTSHDAT